jgi:hypothetical protein
MEDAKALQLFREILAKTKARRIKWEPTANESEYFCVLPGPFIVSIRSWRERDSWGNDEELLALTLRAEDKQLLRVSPDVDGVQATGLRELYELARRQALGVDAQVDRLLGELAKL